MKWLAMLTLLLATQASAHHGWSEYDEQQPLNLSGTVEAAGYENPHGFVLFKTAGKTWHVVLAPPSRLASRGLSRELLASGSRAAVVGYPNRHKSEEMRAERITIGGKTTPLR